MMASVPVAGIKRPFTSMANDRPGLEYAPSKRLETDKTEALDKGDTFASTTTTPCDSPPPPRLGTTIYDADASIVLVGMRGSGKSTLAIIASTAMKRRIIDVDNEFQRLHKLSVSSYKKAHGSSLCLRRQQDVLQTVLSTYPKKSVIVSSWMDQNTQTILSDFASSHPVIHVVRDLQAIQAYLKVAETSKIRDLSVYAAGTFRAFSNFEFFNVTEDLSRPSALGEGEVPFAHHVGDKTLVPQLTLKRAERHLLKFLSLIMPGETIPFIESAYPLASVPTESRQFTYAVSAPLSKVLAGRLDPEDLETGADAIEIVNDDALENRHLTAERASLVSRVFGHIRRNTVIPIIYHVPWPQAGAITPSEQAQYFEQVRHGLQLAPEYVTVDLRLSDQLISQLVESKKISKIIGTVHLAEPAAPAWTDPTWVSYYRKAQAQMCSLVRLTRPAVQIEDNFEIHNFRCAVKNLGGPALPLIAFNTGSKGRNSVCFNPILSPVLPGHLEGSWSEQNLSTPHPEPTITAQQATSVLQSSFVTDAMKVYVIGANVTYSLSPAMHNKALQACGLSHHYTQFSTDSLSNIRHLIHDPLFAGASLGLPFKVEAISLTSNLTSHAKAIGAVNTLVPVRRLNSDGSVPDDSPLINCRNRAGPVLALVGENTDWVGLRACIRRGLSPANAVRPRTGGLVIGAGGMARAAVYSMIQLGVKNIAIFNRTHSNAEKLVEHFKRQLNRPDFPLLSHNSGKEINFYVMRSRDEPWPVERCNYPTMIVSCIPTHGIGDNPAPNFTLPEQWLQSPTGGAVVEYAYKEVNTPLLLQIRAAAHRGWVAMDGLDLLPEQGFAQFELFTGRRAPRHIMRTEVFKSYRDKEGKPHAVPFQPRLDNIVEQGL